jgi:hypothetical membrane protein
MSDKKYALIGWFSGLLFWVTYFVLSTIRPDYYHKYKAVSELGSVGAGNAIIWNVIGFICVGALISLFSVGLHKSISVSGKGKLAFYLLFGSGLFWAFAGIFPGDFANRTSLTMILHAVGSLGSGLLFVLSVFTYMPAMRISPYWRSSVIPSVSIVVMFILSGFLRSGAAPAFGQKVGFLIFFIWVSFMAYKLYKLPVNKAMHQTSG